MQGKFYTCQLVPGMVVRPSIFEVPEIVKVLSCDRSPLEPQYFVCLQDTAGNQYEFYVNLYHEWEAMVDEAFAVSAI